MVGSTLITVPPATSSFAARYVSYVRVRVGDVVAAEQLLATLETDKATMAITAPHGARVEHV